MYHGSTGGGGPGGGPGTGGGLLHAFPTRPLTTDAIYNPSAIYAAAAAAQAYIPFGASDSSAFYPALVTVSHRLNLAVTLVAVTRYQSHAERSIWSVSWLQRRHLVKKQR